MSEKRKPYKFIAVMIIILLLPTLFFTYIGHDPMKKISTASRQIAVVNEDLGAEYENKPIGFGKEIAATLNNDSDYHWLIVNRSTAERGLQNKEYDAVLYLPSDFSKDILTFQEDDPIKAGIQYKIQANLDAKNLEKVQKELESSKNKMNKQISTLYWSYVSQSVEDIRKKFDKILEKEIAFQNSMYSFYTPSSKSLAEEINRQKDMLKGILDSTKDAEKSSAESTKSLLQTKEQVNTFIKNVGIYKEYQDKQRELFLQINQENQQLLNDSIRDYQNGLAAGVQSISELQKNRLPDFLYDGDKLKERSSKIKEKMNESSEIITRLNDSLQKSGPTEQFHQLLEIQKKMMQQYKFSEEDQSFNSLSQRIISLRGELQNASNDGEGQTKIEFPVSNSTNASKSLLTSMKKQISNLKKLSSTDKSNTKKEITAVINQLEEAVAKLEEQLKIQQEWSQKYNSALTQYKKLLSQEDQGTKVINMAIQHIKSKEKEILESPILPEDQKQNLNAYFQLPIANKNIESLLNYYGLLGSYQEVLQKRGTSNDELINNIVDNPLDATKIQGIYSDIYSTLDDFKRLELDLTSSVKEIAQFDTQFNTFIDSTVSFFDEYKEIVEKENNDMAEELQAIQENANEITAKMQEDYVIPEPEQAPVDNLDGEFVFQIQENTLNDIEGIQNMVTSLAERQDNVSNYTNELQNKVGTVQQRADQLNNNWAQNVQSTKKIKGDVYGVLNNTLVDDQNNGYVYDYLANPVKMSGEKPKEQTINMPPVVMLVIILFTGLFIGYFLHHYGFIPLSAHIILFILLNLAVGLVISIYGLRIYPLHDVQAIKWTIFTALLLFFTTSVVRFAFYIGPFIGGILALLLSGFFLTPLIDLVMPNFNVKHPISNVYMSIQYGDQSAFLPAVILLAIVMIVLTIIPYVAKRIQLKRAAENAAG